jgi:pimeloyl-ACP methyl ester carboxylesterase
VSEDGRPAPLVVFLPGASGDPGFWRPVGERLPAGWEKVYLGWPGLGDQPPDPAVRGFDDLVARVEEALTRPADLVAQSMGGVVAIRTALRHADRVRRLVLTATSGGIDVVGMGGEEWRPGYRTLYPRAAEWVLLERPDHTDQLGRITAPTLLLWGDRDEVSPLAAGSHLLSRLPNARMSVVAGGDHMFAHDHAEVVAPLVAAHLASAEG